MTPDDLSPAAARLYAQLAPVAVDDALYGYAMAALCAAVAAPFDQLYGIAHDGETPWAAVMDATAAPDWALDWLGQWVGVRLPANLAPDARRTRVLETDGMRRGTPAAIRGAARQHLTGTRSVLLRERDGSAYALTVITFTAQTPNAALVAAALAQQKPAGLVLDYRVETGQDYRQLAEERTDYAAVTAAFATYEDVRSNIP
jgi:hypothetical protein